MDLKQTGSSLDSLVSSFNARIVEFQDLVIARNMYPATSMPDLSNVDSTIKTMESQIQSIKNRLYEERNAIPTAKVENYGALSMTAEEAGVHALPHPLDKREPSVT